MTAERLEERCHAKGCQELAVSRTRCAHHQKMLDDQIVKDKERKKKKVAQGICASCTLPLAQSSICYCEKHLELANRESKKQREKRKANGICNACSAPAVNGYTHCAKHHENYNQAARNRLRRRKATGKCMYEGCAASAKDSKMKCETHLKQSRQYEFEKRNGLRNLGQCYTCGVPLPPESEVGRCEECRSRNKESEQALKALRKAAGLCVYCGGAAEKATRRNRLSCDKCRRRMSGYSGTVKNRFGRARRTNIKIKGWTLTFEEYAKLIAEPCTYCKLPNMETYGTGLDRLDNKRGYHLDNVVSCCPECNIVRNSIFTPDEMMLLGMAVRQIKLTRRVKFQPNQSDMECR